jgi:hypothetical protein
MLISGSLLLSLAGNSDPRIGSSDPWAARSITATNITRAANRIDIFLPLTLNGSNVHIVQSTARYLVIAPGIEHTQSVFKSGNFSWIERTEICGYSLFNRTGVFVTRKHR